MSIAIVTDTGCNITPTQAKELGVHLLPLEIIFGEEVYKDGFELSSEEFFDKMSKSDELPTTSQPATADAYELYQELSKNYDEILSIHFDSKLSGTFQSMELVAEEIDDANVTVYDTHLVSIPAGELVIEAKRLANKGETLETILDRLDEMAEQAKAFAMFNSLENLVEGGRISAIVGSLVKWIKIKPVIEINNEQIEIVGKIRTEKRAIKKVEEHVIEAVEASDLPVKISIGHGDYIEVAQAARDRLLERYPKQKIEIQRLTSVLGVHAGPELLGIAVTPDYSHIDLE